MATINETRKTALAAAAELIDTISGEIAEASKEALAAQIRDYHDAGISGVTAIKDLAEEISSNLTREGDLPELLMPTLAAELEEKLWAIYQAE